MNSRTLALEKLKIKQKFSNEEWENRGLNPSEKDLSLELEKSLNDLITDLIAAGNENLSEQEIESIFKRYSKKINEEELDTEEREFVVDYFDEITKLLNIESINFWVEETEIYDHEKAERESSEKVLAEERKRHEIISIECSKCKVLLDTFILERDKEIPSFEFDIIKCVKCRELNLLDKGPGIKKFRFLNYELIEELSKEEYDLKKAMIRLEQLKNDKQGSW